jgi:hypothetical protein
MERLDRFDGSTRADGGRRTRDPRQAASRQDPQTVNRITIADESQVESGVESRRRGASDGPGGGRKPVKPGNPIERYIACFATARAAAGAAGVSTAMLRRMRSRGFVSTRGRALLMAQACGFKVKPAELLALTPGVS